MYHPIISVYSLDYLFSRPYLLGLISVKKIPMVDRDFPFKHEHKPFSLSGIERQNDTFRYNLTLRRRVNVDRIRKVRRKKGEFHPISVEGS